MSEVLARIVARKREEVAARPRDLPPLTRSDRDFRAALAAPRTGFICECKCASPSAGVLRPDRPYDPVALARAYAPFADAISVLVDGPDFGGSLAHLTAVRAAVELPVLCKEFVVEPFQVLEARAAGADAILLMLSVLDDEGWRACQAAAEAWSVDTLTEVADEAEMARALALGAPVIGVNSRDLKTLTVDLARGEALLPRVPADRVAVAESGIRTHADVRRLRPLADAFLVGGALASADDVGAATRGLVHGEVKVCGLTRPADARAAWASGATWGGVILAESPRQVSLAQAAEVLADVPLRRVAVTVDAPVDEVVRAAEALGLAAVQLHGDEDAATLAALRERLPASVEIWKARRVRSGAEARSLDGADRLLLDTRVEGTRGGTGQAFDWTGVPAGVVLAGGIGPHNAADAMARAGFIDVNSGVESAPGVKDGQKLTALFGALRGTGREGRR